MGSARRWLALVVALLAVVGGARGSAAMLRGGEPDAGPGHGETIVVARRSAMEALRRSDDRRTPEPEHADAMRSELDVGPEWIGRGRTPIVARSLASHARRSPISARGPPR